MMLAISSSPSPAIANPLAEAGAMDPLEVGQEAGLELVSRIIESCLADRSAAQTGLPSLLMIRHDEEAAVMNSLFKLWEKSKSCLLCQISRVCFKGPEDSALWHPSAIFVRAGKAGAAQNEGYGGGVPFGAETFRSMRWTQAQNEGHDGGVLFGDEPVIWEDA
jgi:hypothetical protein